MAYVGLAAVSDFDATPLVEVVRDLSNAQQTSLLLRASRAVESYCERRLAPFTLSESHRTDDIDVEDATGDYGGPLSNVAIMGMSRAASVAGGSSLVRTINLREWPARWEDMWVGSLVSVIGYPPMAGTITVPIGGVQFEPDTGHLRAPLGTYLPQGSTVVVTYTGGYAPVPDDLVQACILEAAEEAFIWLMPERRGDIDLADLRLKREELLAPYVREQP